MATSSETPEKTYSLTGLTALQVTILSAVFYAYDFTNLSRPTRYASVDLGVKLGNLTREVEIDTLTRNIAAAEASKL